MIYWITRLFICFCLSEITSHLQEIMKRIKVILTHAYNVSEELVAAEWTQLPWLKNAVDQVFQIFALWIGHKIAELPNLRFQYPQNLLISMHSKLTNW